MTPGKKPGHWINACLSVSLWLMVSAIVTYLAFFARGVSFGWILFPFAAAVISGTRQARFGAAAGYAVWVVIISGWGLFKLGYPLSLILAAGLAAIAAASLLSARLGVGLSCLLFLPIHTLPGNPLLATGSVFPGAGIYAVFLLGAATVVIEQLDGMKLRAVSVALLIVAGNGAGLIFASFSDPAPDDQPYKTLDIADILALSERGYTTALADRMAAGGYYITGENLIQSDDRVALAQWCRIVRDKDLTVFLGVQEITTGQGQVWGLNPETCSTPQLIYAARTGIPGITGSLRVMGEGGESNGDRAWLACFEAFSLWRWIDVMRQDPSHVITIAKDYWTEPLRVGLLRKKVAAQFTRLTDRPAFHAEAGKTLLEVQR